MKRWVLLCLLLLVFYKGLAQNTFYIDLRTTNPQTITTGQRTGIDCNGNSNTIFFDIQLNANTDYLSFSTDQICGTCFYNEKDINDPGCGQSALVGQGVCISGSTHVLISFYKPGTNAITYTFNALQTVNASGPGTLRQGCTGTMSVTGLNASSTTWTSIYPGAIGAYNSYLSCTSGCISTNVTPGAGAPAYIDYRVSGTTTNCSASRSAVVRVYTVPPMVVNINPSSAVICSGNPVTLSAMVTGGNPAYSYSWMKDGQSIAQTTATITVSTIGTYTVTVADNTANCSPVSQSATVTVATTPSAPTAPGTAICKNTAATLTATAPGGTYNWYDANGTFQATGASFTTPILTASTTYYVDATSTAGCTSSRTAVLVTVNDIPAAPTAPGKIICSGNTATLTASGSGGSYQWFDAATGGNLKSSNAVFTTVVLSSNTTYYVQTTVNNCTSPRTAVLVTVNPTPSITSLASAFICNNTPQSYAITSDVSGATFSWNRAAVPGISNAAVSGQASSNITESLVNTTSAPIAVTYRITPQTSSCIGQTFTYTVTVNPILSITSLGSAIACNNMAPNYTITSNVSGANFSWSRAAVSGISNVAVSGQTSNTITEALNNVTASNISVTYVIVPNFNSCTGNPFNYRVTVSSTPAITSAANGVACNNEAHSYNITSNISGTTFSWSRAEVTGISNTAVNDQTSSTITETLINTISNPIAVAYSIIPTANGCTGAPFTYTITVNPTPAVTSAASDVICNSSAQRYSIQSNVSGATFTWSRAAITGISNAAVSGQTSSTITETLTNTTSVPLAVAYSIIPTANGCTDAVFTYTLTVNPSPIITSLASAAICNETAQDYTITSNVSGTTFSWSRASVTGISNAGVIGQTSNTITETLVNTTSAPVAVTYTIVPEANGCTGNQFQYVVTVNPTATVTSAASAVICNQTAQNYTITSNVSGATFSWSRAAVAGISNAGFSGQTSSRITETLNNTTSSPILVTYVIVSEANGCTGTLFNYEVTVNPTPTITSPANAVSCNQTNQNYTITSNVNTATFSWGRAAVAGISNAAVSSQSSNTITEVLDNTTSSPVSVTYVILPEANGCAGTAFNYTITVNPTPALSNTSFSQVICSEGGSVPVTLTSDVSGTNFTWTATASAGITGYTGSGTAIIPAQTLVNAGLTAGTVTYTIKPFYNGCEGITSTYTITVNPKPAVNSTASAVICNGAAQNYTISSNINGATFSWGRAAVAGISNPAVNGQTSNTITETLVNTTSAPIVVTYIIVPEANGCAGAAFNYTVTVDPTPAVTSAASVAICNQTSQNYTITSNVSGTTYTWSRLAISGISNPAISGQTSNTITEALVNTTNAPVAVTYNIIPEANGCTGTTFNYTVTVNPTPTVTSAASAVICNQSAQNYILTSDVSVTTFTWSRAAVTGISNAAVGNQNSNTITETLVNTTSAPIAVSYIIVPEANGCAGTTFNYTVTVNPTATITSAASAAVCNETAQNYTLTSNVTGATFNWGRPAIAGISNASVSGQTSNTITEALVNTSSAPIAVTYTIVPEANGCTGVSFDYKVTVNPTSTVTSASSETICNQTAQNYTITSNVSGTTFIWGRAAVAGIRNAAVSSQTSNSITESLTNTTSSPIAVTYTIVPEVNSCSGTPFRYEVTVNPTPALSNTSFNQVICSEGSSVPVMLTSDVSGANFTWTATASAGITGYAASGTVIIPAQTLVNAGLTAGTVTYTIKPFYNGCEGITSTYTITVNPKPATPLVSSNSPVCNGTSLMLTTPAVAGAVYTWTGPNGFTSNLQNPEIANANAAAQGTYSLTITINGCTGNAGTTTVMVNPTPTTPVAGSNGPICAAETLNLTASAIPGASYSWTGPNGFTSSVQNPVINNAQVASSGTYTVKATVNGCISAAGTIAVVVNAIPPAPSVSSNSPVCVTTNLNLTAASIAGANYNWTGPNGFTSALQNPVISSATPANSGTYYVTAVSADGCTSPTSSITVLVNPLPAEPVLTSNSPVCSGNTIVLTCTAYPGVVYQWTGPNNFTSNRQNPVIDNAETANQGRYTVVITTPGCTVTNTAFIDVKVNQTPAAPVASSNSPVCAGQTLKLFATTVAGAIYNWSGPNGFISHLQNPEIADVNTEQGGKYFVTVTVNGCTSAVASTAVIVNKPSVVVVGNAQTVCADNPAVALSGSISGSSTTGIWSTSGSGTFTTGNTNLKGTYVPSAADVASGSVTLTLTATNTSPCAIASASFKLSIIPVPVVFAGNDQEVCINDQVTLNGKITNSNGSIWSSSGTGKFNPSNTSLNALYIPSEKDKAEGIVTLTLTATGNGNCTIVSDQMKIRLVPPPKVNAGQDIYVMQDEHMVLQPAVSGTDLKYNWTPNLYLNNPTLKNPTLTGTEDITYTLTVTGSAGCVAQDQVFVKVLKPITIPNTFTPNNDGINDTWAIKELYNYPDITVKIFNRYGIQLFYSQGYGTPWDGTYNGQPLPVGTYYYIIDLKTYSKLRSGPVTIVK